MKKIILVLCLFSSVLFSQTYEVITPIYAGEMDVNTLYTIGNLELYLVTGSNGIRFQVRDVGDSSYHTVTSWVPADFIGNITTFLQPYDEIGGVYQILGIVEPPPPPPPPDPVTKFWWLDINDDGLIQEGEAYDFTSTFLCGDELLVDVWIDTNGDGLIDSAEYGLVDIDGTSLIHGENIGCNGNGIFTYPFYWLDINSDGLIQQGEAFHVSSTFNCGTEVLTDFVDVDQDTFIDLGEHPSASAENITAVLGVDVTCDGLNGDGSVPDEVAEDDDLSDDPCKRKWELSSITALKNLEQQFDINLGIPPPKIPIISFTLHNSQYEINFATNEYTGSAISFFRSLMQVLLWGSFGYAIVKTFSRW